MQLFFSKCLIEMMRVFRFNLVKIILLKNDNCALTLRKWLFCNATLALLPCKTYAFRMQNNSLCNALAINELSSRDAREKYLYIYRVLFAYKTSFLIKASIELLQLCNKGK